MGSLGPLARRGDADPARRSPGTGLGAVAGHQDAEVDHPLDLGRRGAGETGKRDAESAFMPGVILGAMRPPRRVSLRPEAPGLATSGTVTSSRSAWTKRRSRGSSLARRLPSGSASPDGCRCARRGTPDPCHRDHPARPGVKLETPSVNPGRWWGCCRRGGWVLPQAAGREGCLGVAERNPPSLPAAC